MFEVAETCLTCRADTDDWRMSDTNNPASQDEILENFDRFVGLADSLTTGFIVLAHDLYAMGQESDV